MYRLRIYTTMVSAEVSTPTRVFRQTPGGSRCRDKKMRVGQNLEVTEGEDEVPRGP